LGAKRVVDTACAARIAALPVRLRRATQTLRFRAARPPTFFVLTKKVGKESRAYEGAPAVCPVLLGSAGGPANSRPFGRSDRQALKIPRAPCAARRLRRQALRRLWQRWCRDGVSPLEDAAAVRGGSGAVPGALSERPEGASFAHGPLTLCSARAVGASAQAGLARSPFFGYFLWRSKESNRPRAVSGRSSKKDYAGRAAALNRIAARRAIDRSC